MNTAISSNNISKAILYQAVGVQFNYKTTYSYTEGERKVNHTIYVNEKNRYGYLPRLKSNAIKLLLYYHYYANSRGRINQASITELATLLHTDAKTIRNNNQLLIDYGYIYITYYGTDHFAVFIENYSQMYLTAKQGGTGYLVVSEEMLAELLTIQSTNVLRIVIRSILDLDKQNIGKPSYDNEYKVTYDAIRRYLPKYMKPSLLKKVLDQLDKIFIVNTHNEYVSLTILNEYQSKKQRKLREQEAKHWAVELIYNFNLIQDLDDTYSPFFVKSNIRKPIKMHIHDFEDISKIAATYGIQTTLNAIAQLYISYVQPDKPPHLKKTWGALVRGIIKNRLFPKPI